MAKEVREPRKFLYSLEFWLGIHEKHDCFFQVTTEGQSEIDDVWKMFSVNVLEQEFLDYVARLAPHTQITDQIKTKAMLQLNLDLILFEYKFYTKGAPNDILNQISIYITL